MRPLGLPTAALLAIAALVPLSPARAAAVPTCQGEPATIVGTEQGERLTGTPGPDVIVARDGDDVVHGRGGDDLICGGDGADALRGGPGDDRLYGQREARVSDRGGTYFVGDLLDGGPGDDLLDIGGDGRWVNFGSHGYLDFTHAGSGVTVDLTAGTATGQGADTIVSASAPPCDYDCHGIEVLGSTYDDVLTGNAGPDKLTGNGGNDVLDGRSGADELFADSPSAGGPAGDDVLHGGAGADFLSAHDGRDRLSGDGGGDTLWATEGGPSELYGGTGDDELVAWFATEPGFVIDGGDGVDTGALNGPADPTGATVTMSDGSVVADGTTWGQLAGLEDVGLYADRRWTYEGTDAAEIVRSAGTWLHATTYGGDDEVWGTAGPDRIDAGDGTDKVRASRGRDTCLNAENVRGCENLAAARAARPTCQGEPATIVGTPRDDDLVGTGGSDVIVAGNGNDLVTAGGGDDLVCGGEGMDTLLGGAGDDELHGGREQLDQDRGGTLFRSDVLDGGAGDDLLDVGFDPRTTESSSLAIQYGTVTFDSARRGVTVDLGASDRFGTAVGEGHDRIVLLHEPSYCADRLWFCQPLGLVGSSHDDRLVGGPEPDDISGGYGDDQIEGGAGDDQLDAEFYAGHRSDDDTVSGGPGDDWISSAAGSDVLHGDDGDDRIGATGFRPSEVYGDAGDDYIWTSITRAPGYVLDGGAGTDSGEFHIAGYRYYSTPPKRSGPTLTVRAADDTVTRSGVRTGTIAGLESLGLEPRLRWIYYGTDGDDSVGGGEFWPFRAWTFGGDDTVSGSDKDDLIDAGDGNDAVDGEGGRDTCLNAEVADNCEELSPSARR